MKTNFLCLVALFLTMQIKAQLIVTPYPNPASGNNESGGNITTFVQSNLIGTGITVSNVTFSGANRQLGSFNATVRLQTNLNFS